MRYILKILYLGTKGEIESLILIFLLKLDLIQEHMNFYLKTQFQEEFIEVLKNYKRLKIASFTARRRCFASEMKRLIE